MRFLNPAILNFLWVALVPLLIHLLSRSRAKKVEFSTVKFIKDLEQDSIKNFKIKEWLLILLRTLVIIFLVLAFARPVSQGYVPEWLAKSDALGIIIIDNSASMASESKSVNRLDQAKISALKVLSALDPEIDISVYQTNPPAKLFNGKNYKQFYTRAINSIEQTHGEDKIWEKADDFLKEELEKYNSGIECFIFSDFQSYPEESKYFANESENDSIRWRYYFFPSFPIKNNLAVRDAFPESKIHQPDHLFKLNTRIMNDGTIDSRQIPIQMYVNDDRVGQVVSTLEKGKSKDYLFQAYPGNESIIRGMIKVPEDDFAPDNLLTFDIPLATKIACKLVGNSDEDISLIELALKSIDENDDLLFLDKQVLPEIKRLYLDDYDVLILHNPVSLTNKAIADIQNFLKKGGGVIWFAGEGQKKISEQKGDLALNLPIYLGDSGFRGDAYYTLKVSKEDHSIFSDLNLRDMNSELPEIHRYVESQLKVDHDVIITMNNDRPFLVDCPSNEGRIIYFSSIINMNWNDMPLRGLFVPLLHRTIQYLAADENNTKPVFVDEKKVIQIEKELLKSEWTLISPGGKSYTLVPDFSQESLPITQTDELGRYTLLADGLPYTSFSTVLPMTEYPSRTVDISKYPGLKDFSNIRIIEAGSDLAGSIKEIRLGKSLWRSLFIIMLVFLAIEMILGMTKKDTLRKDIVDNG